MKKQIAYIAVLVGLTTGFCGCDSENTYYEGPDFVLFADSLLDMPVTEDESRLFDVYIGTTQATETDRNFIVDVDVENTNAIEGYHFDLLSRNITIKAGERAGRVRLKGYYEHMNVSDSLAVTLRLVGAEGKLSPLYGNKTNVRLYKCMPFHIDDYVGDMQVSATFPFSSTQITTYNVKTVKKDSRTLVVKEPFDAMHDLVLKFHDNSTDPFDNDIDIVEQIAFTDANYGEVAMRSIEGLPSYYLPADRAFVLYVEAFIPRVASFGAYWYVFKWITPEQAEADNNGIANPYGIKVQLPTRK